MKRLALLIFFFFFLFPQNIFAATLSIQNAPSSINESDEFSVDVFLSCSGCSDSYIRGVFYNSGTNYFGYTQDNNGNFSNAPGSNCTTFFKIAQSDLTSGSWSGKIKFKPDSSSSYFKGSGEYSFKVGRYTTSCSSPSVWSEKVGIGIIGPTFVPTSLPASLPTSTPTKTPTPYPTSVNVSLAPKVTTKPSVKSASIKARKDSTKSGKNTFNIPSPTPIGQSLIAGASESDSKKNKLILLISLFSGTILFIIAAGVLIKKYYREIIEWINT